MTEFSQDVLWTVGQGTGFYIWEDRWLPDFFPLKDHVGDYNRMLIDEVQDLITEMNGRRGWNEEIIEEVFTP